MHAHNGFEQSGCTERVAEESFQRVERNIGKSGARDGHGLHLVIEQRGGAVGVDKGEAAGICPFKRGPECGKQSVGSARGRACVVGVVAHMSAAYLPCPRLRLPGEHYGCRRLAEVEPAAVDVERAALRGRHCLERPEARNDKMPRHVASGHHGMRGKAGVNHACGKCECGESGYAGVAHHYGPGGETEHGGHACSRCGKRLALFDGSLGGAYYKCHSACRHVDAGLCNGLAGRGGEQGVEARQPGKPCLNPDGGTVLHERGGEAVGHAARRRLVAAEGRVAGAHREVVVTAREAERRHYVVGYNVCHFVAFFALRRMAGRVPCEGPATERGSVSTVLSTRGRKAGCPTRAGSRGP